MISYEDLDLRIQADGAGFRVFARRGSQSTSAPFDLDPSLPCDLEDLARGGAPEIERCGATLFEALIRDNVNALYHEGRGGSGPDPSKGLRVCILIDRRDERLRPFVRMPWEILFDRKADTNRWIALDARRPIVRMIDSSEQSLDADMGDLRRVLLVLANPDGTEQLDLERECAAAQEALIRIGVRPRIVRDATRSALHEAISDGAPQVVHFMGHGDLDRRRGEGVIVLEDGNGKPDTLDALTFSSFFVGRPAPRLVILTSCHTAATGRERIFSAFSSVAPALVGAGLPAVIAMQSEVGDRNAIRFTERLYWRVIIANDPVEAAVSEARVALRSADRNTLDWAVPVLYVGAREPSRSSESTPLRTEAGSTPLIGVHEQTPEERKPQVPGPSPVDVPAGWREAIDRALREQRYSAARRVIQALPIEKLSAGDLEVLRELLLKMFASLSKAPAHGLEEHIEWSRGIARTLMTQASLEANGDAWKAASIYDEIYSRFRDLPDVAVQEQVSNALMARADLGWRVLRDPAVDTVADLILARRAGSLTSREDVARALLLKAEIRLDASQFTEALRLLDELIATGAIAATLARARVCRAKSLAGLRRIAPALAQLSDVISTFDSLEPQDAENALEAFALQAALLEDLNRGDEALQSLDRARGLLIEVRGAASPLALRASLMRAATAERLGHTDAAASEYRHVVEFAGGSTALAAYASQARRAIQRLRDHDASDPGGARHVQ